MIRNLLARFVLLLLLAFGAVPAVAGPPYVADDPDPTDTGHWEIYVFGSADGSHSEWGGAAGLDINYGAVEDVQLTATLPIDFSREVSSNGARTRSGAGNLELGVKYRLLHQEREGIDLAIFPRLIVPTARRSFGTGRAQLLLPVWGQRDFGRWSVFGGGGYMLNPGAGNRDFLQSAVAVTRTLTEDISLGVDASWQQRDAADAGSTIGADLGGSVHLGGPFSVLFSGGPLHEHHGATGWRGYTAIELNF